jgi:hypothetical protein
MKLIYFLIIIVIIYVVATQLKVFHVDTLPDKQRDEINHKSKLKSILMTNHVKDSPSNKHSPSNRPSKGCLSDKQPTKKHYTMEDNRLIGYTDKYASEQFQSTDYKRNYWDLSGGKIEFPNASNLLFLIQSEYMDNQPNYKFNISNQPGTTRYPSRNSSDLDAKYIKYIKKNVEGWNELFYKYYQTNQKMLFVRDVKPVFIMETTNEFVIKVNVSLLYRQRTIHFQLTYYGQIERTDDFLNGGTDVYTLQLTEVMPIPKSDFEIQVRSMNENDTGPFMTMEEQMQYVDRINQRHRDEID